MTAVIWTGEGVLRFNPPRERRKISGKGVDCVAMTARRFAWVLAFAVAPVACNSSGNVVPTADAHTDATNEAEASAADSGSGEAEAEGSVLEASGPPTCGEAGCQPLVLAEGTNPSTAGGLVLDSTNVYWLDSAGGQLLACAKTGCGLAPTVLAAGQGGPSGLVVSGGTAYWTNATAGTVSSCATSGCGKNPTVVASGLSSPGGIAVGGSTVYWVETGTTGDVASCATSGCASPTVIATVPGLLLAVDSASIYFTDGAGVNVCPITGCSGAPTVLFAAKGATGIVIDTANVYVTTDLTGIDSTSGAVLSCAKSGCDGKPIALATGQFGPLAIAVSGGTVYWGNTQGDADIWACTSSGCMQMPRVVTMAALPISLAVDSARVYWASLGAVLSAPL
jgi:hypothetical protein